MPTAVQRVFTQTGPTRVGQYREAASQTFKMGDLVGLDSSGNVVILVASGNNWDSTSGTRLLGFAGRDAANLGAASTIEDFPVNIIDMHAIVKLSAWSATPTSAEQQDLLMGVRYVIRNQGGIFVVNLDVTANPVLTLRNRNNDYAATDQFPIVDIQFHTPGNLVHP